MTVKRAWLLLAITVLYTSAAFPQTQIDNLNIADTFVNVSATSNLCANTYVFDLNQQMIACCSSLVPASQQYYLSGQKDLISNPLLASAPSSIVLKVSASTPVGGSCNNSAAAPSSPASGLTTSLGTAPGVGGTPLPQLAPTSLDISKCNFILANGSGFGICGQAHSLNTGTPPSLSISKTHGGNFTQGDFGDSYNVTVSNSASAGPSSGTVTVTEAIPAGLSLAFIGGTGWTCGGVTCSRSDVLNPGAKYPSIVVQVNVAPTATSPQVNTVTVSGGGSAGASATDSAVITPTVQGSQGVEIDNLNMTDAVVNFSAAGSVCVNTYVLDVNRNLLECCSSLIPASQAYYLSAQKDLISNLLNPTAPATVFLKVSASVPNGTSCNPSSPGGAAFSLETSLGSTPGASGTTLQQTFPNSHDLTVCQFIQANGSGFGICKQARPLSGSALSAALSISKTHSGSFARGDLGDSYTVTVSNAVSAGQSRGAITVTEALPAGLALASIAGPGWTCDGTACSRSDVLNAGASFDPITVKVNVDTNATSPQVNQVTVSGGGSASASAADSTVITPLVPGSQGTRIDNLDSTDTVVNFSATANICVNTYVLDLNHNLIECCSSLVAASQPYYLSARNSLISNPLAPSAPSSILLKVSATAQNGGRCDPAAPGSPVSSLTTSLASMPGTNGTSLLQAAPNANDLVRCQFIQANGSGFGICGQAVPFSGSGISLSVGNGQAPAGLTVELPIQLTSTAQTVNGLQADVHYDTQNLTFVSARPGPQLTSAGDSVSATTQPNNDVRLTSTGNPLNTISGGIVAYVTFRLSSLFSSGLTAVSLNNCQASVAGASLTAACSGGIVTGTAAPAALSIAKTHSGNFMQGQMGAPYNVTVSNGASAGPSSGQVTVSESVPSGLTLVSMTGVGWTCGGNTCSRSDVLQPGASYAVIVATVNVAASAASPQLNAVSVAGGGSAGASATDSTVIAPAGPAIILPAPLTVNVGDRVSFPVMLSAPGSGAFVSLSVSDPTVASLNTTAVIIPDNETVSTRANLTGLSNGTVTILATANGYSTGSTQVQVGSGGNSGGGGGGGGGATGLKIILPGDITMRAGDQILFPVTLGAPASADGVFITLSVSNTQVASFNTAGLIIAGGDSSSIRARLNGIAAGTATITASAPGYPTVSQQVQVQPN